MNINTVISYILDRRIDIEGSNSNIVIVDLLNEKQTRLKNIYRSFRPQENLTPREKFAYQLEIVRLTMTRETIILGDFNIHFAKKYAVDYFHRGLFDDFDAALSNFGLEQLVCFVTWSRLVKNVM